MREIKDKIERKRDIRIHMQLTGTNLCNAYSSGQHTLIRRVTKPETDKHWE